VLVLQAGAATTPDTCNPSTDSLRLRWENGELASSLGYKTRLASRNQKKKKKKKYVGFGSLIVTNTLH
jgi:hypothetical protein